MNRDAHASIRGYIYQFNFTIKQILCANEGTEVTVEGIEDFDIHNKDETVAVQCKYYQDTEYNHSKISKAIRFMIKDYYERITHNDKLINYYLYGYFKSGKEKLKLPLTIDFLKDKFLIYTQKKTKHVFYDELGLDDRQIDEFIKRLHINNDADDFKSMYSEILRIIRQEFKCTEFEAEKYYYNNALSLIANLAAKSTIDERKISREQFKANIDKKEILFNKWLLELKGEKKLISEIKSRYFSELNLRRKDRFFIIDIPDTTETSDIIALIKTISEKYSKISQRESAPFCPYIYLNASEELINDIKSWLYGVGIRFTDGYPYHNSPFEVKELHKETNNQNKISLRIIEKLDHLKESIESSSYERIVYQFFDKEPIYSFFDKYTKHIKIATNNLDIIRRII